MTPEPLPTQGRALPSIPTLADFTFENHFFVRPDGFSQHYLDVGSGPPVVMVHGNPTWAFFYRRLVEALSPEYRCLVPDHLGMGLSSRPKAEEYSFTLAERVADLTTLIESWGLEQPVHLVVHDWGGPIGLGWAVAHPEKVASVTVMNCGLRLPLGYHLPFRLRTFKSMKFLRDLLGQRLNMFVKGALSCGVVKEMTPETKAGFLAPYENPADRLAVVRFVQDIPLKQSDISYQCLIDIDRKLDEALAGKPLGLVWGLRDFVFDRKVYLDWQARFPSARTFVLPEAGHLLLEDEPQRIQTWVSEFLKEIRGT